MVETITPVVHGGSRTRWGIAVLLHTLAATAIAGAFGAALGGAGSLLGAPWGSGGALVVAGVALWAFAHEAVGVPFPVPQLRRQVPDWWRTYFPPHLSAALYGAGLGVGFFTYLLHATLVVVAVAAVASGRPVAGAVLVAPFGMARGLGVLAAVRGPDVVHALSAFAARRMPLAAIHAAALASVAIAVGASASGPIDAPGLGLAVVAAAFAWAAAWKAFRPSAWRQVLERYRLGPAAAPVAIAVPLVEAAVPVLAVAGAGRSAALLALASLCAFTAAAARRRLSDGGHVPCGCFGTSETSFAALLARNAVLSGAAGLALTERSGLVVRAPVAAEVLPFTLAVAGVAGVLVAARSVGRSLRGGRV